MKSAMNKKGQEGMSITALLGIVLGIVVVVLLILGFTGALNPIFEKFNLAPSQIQSLAKACEGYATGSLTIDFCTYRNNIEGKDSFVNCLDSRIVLQNKLSCTDDVGAPDNVNSDKLKKVCVDLGKAGNDISKITVNKIPCPTGETGISCQDLGGSLETSCSSGKTQLKGAYTTGTLICCTQ